MDAALSTCERPTFWEDGDVVFRRATSKTNVGVGQAGYLGRQVKVCLDRGRVCWIWRWIKSRLFRFATHAIESSRLGATRVGWRRNRGWQPSGSRFLMTDALWNVNGDGGRPRIVQTGGRAGGPGNVCCCCSGPSEGAKLRNRETARCVARCCFVTQADATVCNNRSRPAVGAVAPAVFFLLVTRPFACAPETWWWSVSGGCFCRLRLRAATAGNARKQRRPLSADPAVPRE